MLPTIESNLDKYDEGYYEEISPTNQSINASPSMKSTSTTNTSKPHKTTTKKQQDKTTKKIKKVTNAKTTTEKVIKSTKMTTKKNKKQKIAKEKSTTKIESKMSIISTEKIGTTLILSKLKLITNSVPSTLVNTQPYISNAVTSTTSTLSTLSSEVLTVFSTITSYFTTSITPYLITIPSESVTSAAFSIEINDLTKIIQSSIDLTTTSNSLISEFTDVPTAECTPICSPVTCEIDVCIDLFKPFLFYRLYLLSTFRKTE
jgi:hypothetical protein